MMKSATDLSAFYVPPPSGDSGVCQTLHLDPQVCHKEAYTSCLLSPQCSLAGSKGTPYRS